MDPLTRSSPPSVSRDVLLGTEQGFDALIPTMTPYGILFQYERSFDDRLVDHYQIVDPTRRPRRRGVRP